jgi:HEAT repeat protein
MSLVRPTIYALMIVSIACHSVTAEEPSTLWGKTLDGWITALRERTGQDRRMAVVAVGHFGQAAKAAAPDLIELVRKRQNQEEAVDALVRIAAGAEVTVPALIKRFVQEGCARLTAQGAIGFNPHVKDSLVRIGRPAVPAFIGVLNGPNLDMRACAAEALGEIGPPAQAAVPSLIRALATDRPASDPPVLRRHAVKALGAIGADAKAVVPLLNG